jgi:hypothetical protein
MKGREIPSSGSRGVGGPETGPGRGDVVRPRTGAEDGPSSRNALDIGGYGWLICTPA